MSLNRRHLVSRSRQTADSSPAPRARGSRDSEAPARQQHALPPYEPPTFPLSAEAKRKLDDLRTKRDTTKYSTHIKGAIVTITQAAASCNDRLSTRQHAVRNNAGKRRKEGIEDADKPQEHIDAEKYLNSLKKRVDSLTEESEKALRTLIDLSDEVRMQDIMLRDVEESIPDPPAKRQRNVGEDDGEDENEAPAADAEILSLVELVKNAKAEYVAKYQSRPLIERYGDSNAYKDFKRHVHDAQNHGEGAPPVPHAKTWFPEENSSSRRRNNNTTDNTNNGDDDSDDEIVMQSATTNLKCPITATFFVEPFSTNICPHTFEKAAITEYYDKNATAFVGPGNQRSSVRRFKCPQLGCDQMLTLSDFYDDALMARKVKRALKAAARGNDNDDDDDDDDDDRENAAPRGTQRNRPEKIGSDDETMDVDQDDARQKRLAKFKREQTRGLSVAPERARSESSEPGNDEIEVMDMA